MTPYTKEEFKTLCEDGKTFYLLLSAAWCKKCDVLKGRLADRDDVLLADVETHPELSKDVMSLPTLVRVGDQGLFLGSATGLDACLEMLARYE